ncbi:MAG TPA: phosphotransferase family protein [Ramlibacter sp.]|uniref:phosphotransferase family protein n=1 Tax=Ramlibacter sp. TaxID=1917967 RepID=UPI002D0A1C30|nr:phosphotransferase family protein [Ramlibacter sp.]HVZ44214.1 phosphotransferase family protein [Ramlibacter sp.]
MQASAPNPAADFDPNAAELPRRLAQWLSAQWHAPVEVLEWRRFPVGMSWVTIGFAASVAGRREELILRLGDPQGLFGPYRTEPEFLALTALAQASDVPIPRVRARSDDTAILGAPFIVTERVDGDTPTPWNGAASKVESERVSLAREFSDVLGSLHAFDWRSTPLAAWASHLRADNVARTEIRKWALETGYPSLALPPAMHYAMRWLEAHAPASRDIVLVHGDYRVGNFLRKGAHITAILDWELVHLGDPHEDLAWAGLRAFSAGSGRIGGFIERAEFHERYTARSGIAVDTARLKYFEVLMLFKSAAMLLGAQRRAEQGRARDVRMAAMGFQLAPTLVEVLRAIEEAS